METDDGYTVDMCNEHKDSCEVGCWKCLQEWLQQTELSMRRVQDILRSHEKHHRFLEQLLKEKKAPYSSAFPGYFLTKDGEEDES